MCAKKKGLPICYLVKSRLENVRSNQSQRKNSRPHEKRSDLMSYRPSQIKPQVPFQPTYLPQLGQSLPGMTQTVAPFFAQVGHLFAGTLESSALVRNITPLSPTVIKLSGKVSGWKVAILWLFWRVLSALGRFVAGQRPDMNRFRWCTLVLVLLEERASQQLGEGAFMLRAD
jgi:hypothetical protein